MLVALTEFVSQANKENRKQKSTNKNIPIHPRKNSLYLSLSVSLSLCFSLSVSVSVSVSVSLSLSLSLSLVNKHSRHIGYTLSTNSRDTCFLSDKQTLRIHKVAIEQIENDVEKDQSLTLSTSISVWMPYIVKSPLPVKTEASVTNTALKRRKKKEEDEQQQKKTQRHEWNTGAVSNKKWSV